MTKRIGIIGNFGKNKKIYDGQTIKTIEINQYIESYYNIKTDKFDTSNINKNIFKIIFNIKKILKNNDIIIVILYTRGYRIITPILTFYNKYYKRKLFDFVIGGKRYYIYKNNSITKASRKYERIYVETSQIKDEYNKRNLNNVEVISNFKNLKQGNFHKTTKNIRLCIFSRILKEKGIEESIKAVISANDELNKNIFSLDIYGEIKQEYKNEFDQLLKTSPKYIKYNGKVDYDKSVEILNKYDMMMFLTYYKNEGFPGTIIDAFFSGLPVIASDWNYNFEILKDNYTGIKVNIDIEEISNKLIKLSKNLNQIDKMKKNCLKESKKYEPDLVMKKFIDLINK